MFIHSDNPSCYLLKRLFNIGYDDKEKNMFSKQFFQALTFVYATAMLLGWSPTPTEARVIANDLSANSVAVYYFDAQVDGFITDYSTNGLTGGLFNNAQIRTVSGRKSLSLGTNRAVFAAWNDTQPLSVNKEFSIVAWVKVPPQGNGFGIDVLAYNVLILDVWDIVEESSGSAYLSITGDGAIQGVYEDSTHRFGIEVTDRNVNNNRWHHVGFVINNTAMKLYLNGKRIANLPVDGHRSFRGSGTVVLIGNFARGAVDDVGFFSNDFTDAQVRLIYTAGLKNIISIAAVDPNAKVATTWGALKHQ